MYSLWKGEKRKAVHFQPPGVNLYSKKQNIHDMLQLLDLINNMA